MRLGNDDGRLVLIRGDEMVDVATRSEGRFGPDPMAAFDDWAELVGWARSVGPGPSRPADLARLSAPVPRPRQVVAAARSYREGAEPRPAGLPPIFTKFPSSIVGPDAIVDLPGASVDWEVELVVVVGHTIERIDETNAWAHVAGLTVGQDLTDRELQRSGPVPQFALAKSFPGFSPLGPVLVTPDEFADPDAIGLRCSVNGETVQNGNTRDLLYPIPVLLSRLARILTLHPGDLVFTGTPAGSGMTRTPPRYLRTGDELVSEIDGIGAIRQVFA
ncbi:fumarylacetoacetate hydrolase family protein [Microbacteriaceae bacterium VKM Ac-2854]|nr:fumarylacetoacetate hydrolase family protein [Microbacteriaceae bacterium VKM Ac-2854]